jgi:diguanylate cyclase (GGDEF)-like protein
MVRTSEDTEAVVELSESSSSAIKILIADDSPLYRRLLIQSFEGSGYTILSAKNGNEALAMFAEHNPDLVITDWTMPDLSGINLCQTIRSEYKDRYPYLVILTGNTQKEEVIEGLAAGADDYLTKPFHPGELQARVRVGLRIIQLHREIHAKNQQLELLALTDPLTGLPNRRAIDIWATRELSAAKRHRFSIWVAIADLDHFKKVNDTYGHDIGDEVLKQFGEILTRNTRESNICGRLGGEEFLVILTHLDQHQARTALERIRCELQDKMFSARTTQFRVTASFGIAGLGTKSSSSFNSLIKDADDALYAAKRDGRNRIQFLME